MENEVNGPAAASLMEGTYQTNDNLEARVAALQTTVANLKMRVQKLELVNNLVSDVSLMEREMGVLKSKTEALEKAVGNRDAPATGLTETEEKAAKLLAVDEKRIALDLKARVASLEQDASDVKSRVASLEVEVGQGVASLLEVASQKGDNMEDRVAILKATVADLKLRVHKLESGVTGLVQKTSKYLVNDVTLLESEMGVLKTKTAALEKAVGNKDVTGTGADETEETPAELLAVDDKRSTEDLKARVASLEQDAADVKSRVASMENEVGQG